MNAALVTAVLTLSPSTMSDEAVAHVEAARAASQETGQSQTLLLAMAYVESKYTLDAYAFRKGSHLCGPLQIATRSQKTCDELRSDISLSYLTAAQRLSTWGSTKACRARDDVGLCALQGYGGGWRSVEREAMRYARRVRMIQRRIEREMSKVEVS